MTRLQREARMTVILIIVAALLTAALVWSLIARRRDRKLVASRESMVEGHRQRVTEATTRAERNEAEMHRARADTTEELAEERSARHRAEAELHEARARIAALEQHASGDDARSGPRRLSRRDSEQS